MVTLAPMEEADARLFNGDQGSGKTESCVAIVVDDAFAHIQGIVKYNGKEIVSQFKARPLNSDEIQYLKNKDIRYDPLRDIYIWNPSGNDGKIIRKPSDYVVVPSFRIFANYHLYGLRFMFIDGMDIVEHINDDEDGLMCNGYLLLSESILIDRQDTMTKEGKMTAKFGAQLRKRHLITLIDSQYAHMTQSRFNLFCKTHVLCTFDKETKWITLDVNENSSVMRSTSYDSRRYRPYFNTDERIKTSQRRVNAVLKDMME